VNPLRYAADVRQAADNLRAQKTRTLLTALGIVFGVGSVIGMLSIGAGAREESMRMIEKLGVRNLLVESRASTSQEELQQRRRMSPGLTARDVRILEANIDDMTPEVFGYVMDRLLEAGALDVFATPIHMKKNRPGSLLTILAKPEDTAKLTEIVFAETTTLGVRRREETRQILARKWTTVTTHFGDVRIKIASLNGTVTSYAPEYEDCRRIAAEHRVPLKLVMQEAVQQYLRSSK